MQAKAVEVSSHYLRVKGFVGLAEELQLYLSGTEVSANVEGVKYICEEWCWLVRCAWWEKVSTVAGPGVNNA